MAFESSSVLKVSIPDLIREMQLRCNDVFFLSYSFWTDAYFKA